MVLRKITIYAFFMLFLFLICCSRSIPVFDEQNSFELLEKQVEFGPRNPGGMGHSICRDWLIEELENYSERVIKQDFQHYDKRRDTTLVMSNIIASFNLRSKHRVLLCAHWDTRPFADQDDAVNSKTPISGANDGASGVAVLLEIARVMKLHQPPLGVDILLFDGEDYGPEGSLDEYFLGSRYFADNLGTYKPRYGILLDMVGDAQLNLPIEYHSNQYARTIVEKVWDSAEELGYEAFEPRVGSAVSDDHIQLNQAGIPCIDIIDFKYPDDSNRYWHTTEDTADKCSAQSLKIVGQTLLQVIFNEDE